MDKRVSRRLVLVLFVMAALAAVAGLLAQVHSHASLPDPSVALAHDPLILPLALIDGRPIVKLLVNGSGPYPFILDTGAEGTLITEALAEELKLPVLGEALAASPGAAKPRPAKLVRIEHVELGALTISDGTGVALDSSSLPQVFSGPGAPMGVLSIRGWKGLLVTVDYPANQIVIRHGALAAADGVEIYQFRARDRLPVIAVDFAGTPVEAHVDTGAARGIVLPRALQSKLPLMAQPVPAESVRTVSGEQVTSSAQLRGPLRLGGLSIENPELNFVDEFPLGNLGYPILRNFAVTVDWQTHRVQLARASPPA